MDLVLRTLEAAERNPGQTGFSPSADRSDDGVGNGVRHR